MDIIDLFIRLGALAGAITALIALWKKMKAPLASMQESVESVKEHLAEIDHRTEKIAKHDHEQYLGILRLTIMSPEMPISERLIAGQKYIDEGGNGDVKHYYQELVRTHTIQNPKN